MRLKRLLGVVLLLPLAFLPVFVLVQRQAIIDWVRLYNYEPQPQIQELATNTTMTNEGRKLFYVNRPELNDKTTFREQCNRSEESIVLGCYLSGDNGIHILDVQDERLDGIHEVTAAHEMLHAAYERLSAVERTRIDRLTEKTYRTITNDRIRRIVENYRQRDPSIVPNELHSILATEVRELPPELEAYYAEYFDNRLDVVVLSDQYEQVFVEQETYAETLEARIGTLRDQINNLEASLLQRKSNLDSQRDTVGSQSEVDEFNRQVDAFNRDVERLQALVDEHNELIAEYKELELTRQNLLEAIDARIKSVSQ